MIQPACVKLTGRPLISSNAVSDCKAASGTSTPSPATTRLRARALRPLRRGGEPPRARIGLHLLVRPGRRTTEVGLQAAGALLLACVGLAVLPVPWHSVFQAAGRRWALTAVAVIGVGCAGIGLVLAELGRHRLRRWGPQALPWWFGAACVVIVVAAGAIALTILLGEASSAAPPQRPQLRIRPRSGPGLASPPVLAPVSRWYWHCVDSGRRNGRHAHEEFDATQRRVTDLYTKAADQLGSDKAAVRLAGLYALERLAQGNPSHRQTIVDVICAYLRMPYMPPDDATVPPTPFRRRRPRPSGLVVANPSPSATDPREELQVRITAQDILRRHLVLPLEKPEERRTPVRIEPDPDTDFGPAWA